jgi:hypothetical protein
MTTWITDANGNRASVEYWGSEAKAQASLQTLTRCTDCTDCTGCTRCTDCTRCMRCTGCTGCTRCTDCTGCMRCTGCNLTLPSHRLPVADPRGYTWLAILEDGQWRIRAGCRSYTVDQARNHWLASAYDGPLDVRETVGVALAWISTKTA